MPTLKRPGVYTEEILLNPQQSLGGSSVVVSGAFLGTNGRGPLNPTFISTWSDYVANFGTFTGNYFLPHALFQYFANGGQGVWVSRVPGVGSATAVRTLLDRGGTPAATLSVSALSPGAWGNTIFIDVADSGVAGTGRFSVTVHSGDATGATVVEKYDDLSMVSSDARYAPNVINAGNNNGSKYIVVADLVSTNSAAQALPAAQTGTVLAGGADGTAAGLNEYTVALNLLAQIQDPIVLNLPGVSDSATLTVASNYAQSADAGIFLVVDTAQGLTSSTAIAAVSTLPINSNSAAYWPWILVNDPSTATPGSTKFVPPGGAVVGQYMRTDNARGVWKAPAGITNRLASVVALEVKATNTDLDALNTSVPPVNALRNIPGVGPCIMGARTFDPTTLNRYIPGRRTLQYLKAEIKRLMLPALFEPNDPILWARITNDISAFLMTFWSAGGLLGGTPQAAYYVKCDSSINTPNVISSGQVIAEVGVSVQTPAEYVVLRIGQTNGGASVADNS